MPRPVVSVIVPFYGGEEEAREVVTALGRIALREGDELIVADNTGTGVASRAVAGTAVRAVDAPLRPSSYYARNVGAENAANDWLLFLDADCRAHPEVLDRYFAEPIPDDWGAVAGEIVPGGGPDNLVVRYQSTRAHLRQEIIQAHPYRPMAVTANLLVRRAAWVDLGGFHEGIRSAGDSDFTWRLPDRGWSLGYRAGAVVEHEFTSSLSGMARRFARYGAGGAWAARRHPGYRRPPVARGLARAAVGTVVWPLAGQPERGLFKALDGVVVAAGAVGWLLDNTSAAPAGPSGDGVCAVALVDTFPELSQTFVRGELRELRSAGHQIRVEAGGRAEVPSWPAVRDLDFRFLEDDGLARKAADMAWLAARHPLGCLRDLLARRRWRREEAVWPLRSLAPVARRLRRGGEAHVHAYFAAEAALNAMRLARLLGVTYSVTAYAYDIYQRPRNLREKLSGATFVTTVSEEGVAYLRELVGPEHASRVHEVWMGVDGDRFARRTPYPDGRTVLAVGRLVEKKGFADLVSAATRLRAENAADRVRIVGDGPLREELQELVARERLEDFVELVGRRGHDEVREELECAAVLAMPCVVATDGDRDSVPNVVAEALAMGVPVVATDVAGLPELVQPPWGRVVGSRDPDALAGALSEVLSLPAPERAQMGIAGREFVLAARDPAAAAAIVAGLVADASGQRTSIR